MAGGGTRSIYRNYSAAASSDCLPRSVAEQEAISRRSVTRMSIKFVEQLLIKKRQIKQGAMQEFLTGKRRLPGFSRKWESYAVGHRFEISGWLSVQFEFL